jgi:hypothetical protein
MGLTHLEIGMEGNIKQSVNFKQFLAFKARATSRPNERLFLFRQKPIHP